MSWACKLRRAPSFSFEDLRQEILTEKASTEPPVLDNDNNELNPQRLSQNVHSSSSPMEVLQQLEEPPSPTPLDVPEQGLSLSEGDLNADLEDIVPVMIKLCSGEFEGVPDREIWEKLAQEV